MAEGFFSFVEGEVDDAAADGSTGLSAESLLMEAARRIDEWTRIAQLVPNMGVMPALAEINADHAPMLDLRPNEWEVLSAIDGHTDLRAIGAAVGVSDFDVAESCMVSCPRASSSCGRRCPPVTAAGSATTR